jgi:ABC-type oligopeptide transport system ATPase subunit
VELGPAADIVDKPLHPCTKALISAVFPPGLEIAWKSATLAKILPQPDSRHGCLRMSLVFIQSKRALNSRLP